MKQNELTFTKKFENKINKHQQQSDLQSVTVKNIFLDPQCDIAGIKNRNNVRIPLKNLRPYRQKVKKNLFGVFPELPNQIKKDFGNIQPQIPQQKIKSKKGDSLINMSENNKKNTFLLNSIIQILQNKEVSTLDNDHKVCLKPKPKIKTEPNYTNQFSVELNPVPLKNSRKPRIIENNITKLHNNHDNLLQRKIFSEQKSRRKPQGTQKHLQSWSKVQNLDKNAFLLTFYKAKQHKIIRKSEDEANEFIDLEIQ